MRYVDIDAAKRISKVGLGTWQFGSKAWGYGDEYDEREAPAIVRRALELGVTLFDTAELYSAGRSERILGRALGRDRDAAFLATKFFPLVPSARVVRQRAAWSARRLGVTYIDLYQSHWPNPLVPDRAIMRGMQSLRAAGLIGQIGVSNYSVARWRAAEDALGGRILTNQVQYSLVERSPELELLPFAESAGRVLIAFSPLARGFLSGAYHGGRPPEDRVRAGSALFHPDNLSRTASLMRVLREVADAHDVTPAQIAIAWVIRHPLVAAIPGVSSVAQVESNAAAADIDLADDENEALRAVSAPFRPIAEPGAGRYDSFLKAKHSARAALRIAATVWQDMRSDS